MNNTTTTSSGGIGLATLLTVVFVVLKLTGVIAWSWIWILSPLWISIGLSIVVLLLLGILTVIFSRK